MLPDREKYEYMSGTAHCGPCSKPEVSGTVQILGYPVLILIILIILMGLS